MAKLTKKQYFQIERVLCGLVDNEYLIKEELKHISGGSDWDLMRVNEALSNLLSQAEGAGQGDYGR